MIRDSTYPPFMADGQHFPGCCAGIVASAVLAVNVVVNYQHKLADFLGDLASESAAQSNPEHKAE